MEKEDLIKSEIEKTLQSLDGIGRAEANPYLFSKLMNSMEKTETVGKNFNFKLALGTVIICIIVNVASYFYIQKDSYTAEYSREYQIKSLTSEYFSINNIYFY